MDRVTQWWMIGGGIVLLSNIAGIVYGVYRARNHDKVMKEQEEYYKSLRPPVNEAKKPSEDGN